jgi:hypothetical protein
MVSNWISCHEFSRFFLIAYLFVLHGKLISGLFKIKNSLPMGVSPASGSVDRCHVLIGQDGRMTLWLGPRGVKNRAS